MKRTVNYHLRLTKEEAEQWKAKADMTCMSVSSLVRTLMNGFVPREKPDEEFYKYMRELSAIGNNINQLATKANALGFVDAPMLQKEAERWHKFQADVEAKFLRPEKSNLKWQ